MITLLIISTITWYQSNPSPIYVSSLSTTNYSNMRQISILKGTNSNYNNKLSRQISGNRRQNNKRTSTSMQLGSPPGAYSKCVYCVHC